MAHKKSGGSSRNGRDSDGRRLGVKAYGGETVNAGSIIIRQRGAQYVAGSNVGQGKGAVIGAVIGAVAGGIAGQAIENNASKQDGLEITVRLDNGELRAIVQAVDGQQFQPGERVRLLSGAGGTRVTKL